MSVDPRSRLLSFLLTVLLLTVQMYHSAPAAASSENTRTAVGERLSPAPAGPNHRAATRSLEPVIELTLGGGGLIPWETTEEAGNGLLISASYGWSDFRAGLTYGAALPDSRSQGLYHNVWSEFGWFFLGRTANTRFHPYVSAGVGVALADDAADVRLGDPVTVRWNSATSLLAVLAVGLRFGETRGLFLDVSLRTFNHTFGGYCLSAGFGF